MMEQQVYWNIEKLQEVLKPYEGGRLFLVTGKSSYDKFVSPLIQEFLKPFTVTRYSDFDVNPTFEDALRGLALFDKHDLILAIGGGSVIDIAKLINGGQSTSGKGSLLDICQNRVSAQKGVPFVAIPTTAGSGSEATRFAVVYIEGKKHSFESINIKPQTAIVDSVMSSSMPSSLTAVTGFDALSQAVEAFWSVNSTNESKKDAKEAIELISPVLEKAVNSPDEESRRNLAKGAWLAGRAIDVTKTTAPHAMSYFMTTRYGLPHGHGVALFLGRYLTINSPASIPSNALKTASYRVNDFRGEAWVTKNMDELFSLFKTDCAKNCQNLWFKLMKACGLETDLEKVGLNTSEAVDYFFDNINEDRLKNNPVMVDFDFLKRLWFPALYD
jgi:alcohol dehydrogenase class IV